MKLNIGSIFGDLIDPTDLAKKMLTSATASFSKPIVSDVYQGMRAEGRQTLAGKLRRVATHLDAGECDAASDVTADIIDDIKL
jgi:hypothetical protein